MIINILKGFKINFSKSLLTISFGLILSLIAYQPKVQSQTQIFGLAGYQLNGDVTVAKGDLNFDDGFSYGFGLDIPVDRQLMAEISWSMCSANVNLDQYLGVNIPISDLYIHTFQAGGLIEPSKGKKVSPFGLLTLGASLFHPLNAKYDDEWRFSIALGGGVKVEVSDKIGLRFQGRLIVPMQFAGTSVWFGSGGGGVSVGAYTSFVEGDFSGGIYYRL